VGIVDMLVGLGGTVLRFLVGPRPRLLGAVVARLISRLSFTGLEQFLVQSGSASVGYSGEASKSIVSGAGRALFGMGPAWHAVLLAMIVAGVLWWRHRL